MNTNVNKNNSRLTLSLTFKGFIISSFFDDDGYTNIYIYINIYIHIYIYIYIHTSTCYIST